LESRDDDVEALEGPEWAVAAAAAAAGVRI